MIIKMRERDRSVVEDVPRAGAFGAKSEAFQRVFPRNQRFSGDHPRNSDFTSVDEIIYPFKNSLQRQ